MKTVISLPGRLFKAADALARRLGVSRSTLFLDALNEYLAKHAQDRITQRLNEVYCVEDGSLDDFMKEAARQTLKRSEW